jgi:hypothetical protein
VVKRFLAAWQQLELALAADVAVETVANHFGESGACSVG